MQIYDKNYAKFQENLLETETASLVVGAWTGGKEPKLQVVYGELLDNVNAKYQQLIDLLLQRLKECPDSLDVDVSTKLIIY